MTVVFAENQKKSASGRHFVWFCDICDFPVTLREVLTSRNLPGKLQGKLTGSKITGVSRNSRNIDRVVTGWLYGPDRLPGLSRNGPLLYVSISHLVRSWGSTEEWVPCLFSSWFSQDFFFLFRMLLHFMPGLLQWPQIQVIFLYVISCRGPPFTKYGRSQPQSSFVKPASFPQPWVFPSERNPQPLVTMRALAEQAWFTSGGPYGDY